MNALTPSALAWLRSQVFTTRDYVYLNSGYTGPGPKCTGAVIGAWSRGWYRKGLTTPDGVREETRVPDETRRRVATLLNCDPDEVALTGSTSDGIGIVASGLDWQEGDEVVTNEMEHASGLLPWFLLQKRRGIRVKAVCFPPSSDPLEVLAGAITAKTRLVCVSQVMYCTGLLLPVDHVARLAHEAGALCLIDGAQSAGNMPLDMSAMGCDFFALPGQKWLLGPPGTGALYVCRKHLDRLWPSNLGWNSVESFDMEGRFSLWPTARRYEPATQPYVLLVALGASLAFAEGLGREAIYSRISSLTTYLRARLGEVPGLRLVESGPWGQSALVCFALDGWDPPQLVARLLEGWRIVCRSLAAPACVRVCPHFFNTEEELDTLINALKELAAKGP